MGNETITESLVYEYWDCKYCGERGIRGDHETCPQCGHARDQDITFYRKAEEEVVEDARHVARFSTGADWVCSFCTTLNDNAAEGCRECGASREASEQNYFDVQRKKAERQAPPLRPPARKGGWLWKGTLTALLVMGGLAYYLTRTHEVVYEVAAVSWERQIPIERYGWATLTDWEDELRGDEVRRLESHREVRRYERRQVGTRTETFTEEERYQSGTRRECTTSYESTGSGAAKKRETCQDVPEYAERTVQRTREVPEYQDFPIYGTRVTYRAKLYQPLRTATASGSDNHPVWPDLEFGRGEDGREDREGPRSEHYTVTLVRRGKDRGPLEQRIRTTHERFTSLYLVGQKLPFRVSNMGRLKLPPDDEPQGK